MDQSKLFDALRSFYPTKFEDDEPTEFTKIENLTKEQMGEIIEAKKLVLEDLTQEISALNTYRLVKFKVVPK